MTPPRLHLIAATAAPIACVIRRGPTAWFHLVRWHHQAGEVEHGAWTKIKLYPERCALSGDGDRLAVFALGGEWGAYFAVSRAPWLHALAAWKTVGTWTTGAHFEEDGSLLLAGCADGKPLTGTYPEPVACLPLDVHWVRAGLFRELRTGWEERVLRQGGVEKLAPPEWIERLPAPVRSRSDSVVLSKPDPENPSRELILVSLEEKKREYYLREGTEIMALEDTAVAEWAGGGVILTTSRSGYLKLLDQSLTTDWEYDMNRFAPDPHPAPQWARSW